MPKLTAAPTIVSKNHRRLRRQKEKNMITTTETTPIRHYKKVDAAWIRKMHEGLKALGYTYKNGVQQMLGSIPEWIALHSDGTVSAKHLT
jgi:hypothetical protein